MREITTKREFLEKRFSWQFMGVVLFADGFGIIQLDEDRRAVITLMSRFIFHHYDALKVEIINKRTGEIDSRLFPFDMLPATERADDRSEYLIGPHHNKFTAGVVTGSFDWYIAVPKSTDPLVNEIMRYIGQWR